MRPSHLVLEAGDAEVEHVQDAVELGDGQVSEPLLQHHLVSVLQHPQQADEQAAAGLRREGAMLTSGLGREGVEGGVNDRHQGEKAQTREREGTDHSGLEE